PAVVAFVWVVTCQFDWLDMERSACLRREETVAPTVPGKVNGLLKEDRLVEGDIKLKPRRTGTRGFRKKKIAAACAAADAKVASFDGELPQRRRDRVRRDRFFVRRKARFFAAGCVNHVAAEQHHLARRRLVRLVHAGASSDSIVISSAR